MLPRRVSAARMVLASAALALCGARASAFVISPGHSWPGCRGGLFLANSARAGLSDGRVMPRRPTTGLRVSMGVYEWRQTCSDESGEAPLGCMPFPLDDLLLPGCAPSTLSLSVTFL
jgi:hypothetical protein